MTQRPDKFDFELLELLQLTSQQMQFLTALLKEIIAEKAKDNPALSVRLAKIIEDQQMTCALSDEQRAILAQLMPTDGVGRQ